MIEPALPPSEDVCFYCEALLAKRHEMDHFPIPQEFGGVATVRACMNCHELKDRSVMIDWPLEHVVGQFLAIPAGALELASRLIAENDADSIEEGVAKLLDDWQSIPASSRVLLAKAIRAAVARANLDDAQRECIDEHGRQQRQERLDALNLTIVDMQLDTVETKIELLERQRRILVEALALEHEQI